MRDSPLHWQKILTQGFSSSAELLTYLNLPVPNHLDAVEQQFKTRVPRGFAALMEPGNPHDPLLLQVLAQSQELDPREGFVVDPLQEAQANPVTGLLHKYQGRVLLTLTGSCAINCRYCFRRHFPYQENNPGRQGWYKALDYIAADASIHEVILSGGDPLLVKDEVLMSLLLRLETIPHVKTLRIHSRIPVVLPERVTSELLQVLTDSRLQLVIVLHSNHPRELDTRVESACQALRQIGCYVLNQSVLLAGVNDQADTLQALSQRLFQLGVLPYYLHVLDKVQGSAHFEVSLPRAQEIYAQLQCLLPGYLVPKLVREQAGKAHKTLV